MLYQGVAMIDLNTRVVVITGGSAGVGRALAQSFALEGCRIALLARGEEKLSSTVLELEKMGAIVIAYQVDVANPLEVEDAAAKIEQELGEIYLWINDAMTSVFAKVTDTSPEEFKRTTEVTYLGSVYGTMAALKYMVPRNRGHIMQIGSALAYQSIPLQAAYCGAKHGVRGFLQSLRIELKHDKSKIKISELQLPAVNTPQFEWVDNHLGQHPMPVPPIFQPEVVSRAAVFLAKNPRREMWLGGPTVKAILGAKFAPRVAEWYLSKVGLKSQVTDKLPVKNDNALWKPVKKDYGSHGSFDKEARGLSVQYVLNTNRKKIFSLLGLAAGALIWRKS